MVRSEDAPPLTFGIYPGSATGSGPGLFPGPLDDPARIQEALTYLQGAGHPLVARGYLQYVGAGRSENQTPAEVEQYIRNGRRLELVLCYRAPDGDLDDWAAFVRATVRRYGSALAILQLPEEPNHANPGGDGGSPNVRQAIVTGVVAAKDEARRLGLNLLVGFNATPIFNPNDDFWPTIAALSTPDFLESLDYVGFDFFPDVFRRLAPDGEPNDLREAVPAVLRHYRNVSLAAGHIPAALPIRIQENGWPTGPERPEERQAVVLETVVRTVYSLRQELNITHYTFFNLRDTDSSNPDVFFHFGLMRDDYTPKPAFQTYRKLIAELGTPTGAG